MAVALLDALFSQPAVGLHVLDTELRVERVHALSDAVGADQLVGLHFTEAYRLDDPEEAQRLLHQVLESGLPVLNRVFRGRLMRAPGPSRSLMVTLHRLDDPRGRPLGLLAAVVDINEREKARSRAECLTAVRREVGHSLDVAATCEGLVTALVPRFADFAVVEVVDEILRGSPLRSVRWGAMSRCAARHSGGPAATAWPETCGGCPAVRRSRSPSRICAPGCPRSARTPRGWPRIRTARR